MYNTGEFQIIAKKKQLSHHPKWLQISVHTKTGDKFPEWETTKTKGKYSTLIHPFSANV